MASKKPSIARSFGEFFGHILRGVRTKVSEDGCEVEREEVTRQVEEEQIEPGVTLRRTTIEEIEIRRDQSTSNSHARDES